MNTHQKLNRFGELVDMTPEEIAGLGQDPGASPALPPRPHLSPAQLAIVLMRRGVLTPAEAVEFAASGAIPATLLAAIDGALQASGLSALDQAEVKVKLCGALEYRLTDPATPIIGAAMGLDAAGLDALWEEGAAL